MFRKYSFRPPAWREKDDWIEEPYLLITFLDPADSPILILHGQILAGSVNLPSLLASLVLSQLVLSYNHSLYHMHPTYFKRNAFICSSDVLPRQYRLGTIESEDYWTEKTNYHVGVDLISGKRCDWRPYYGAGACHNTQRVDWINTGFKKSRRRPCSFELCSLWLQFRLHMG